MKEFLKVVYDALEEKKAEKISVIDISEISDVTDYFVIANGTNMNQVQALADNVEEKLNEIDVKGKKIEGYKNAEWILMDYEDFVVHIFTTEQRDFYSLDKIWSDGKEISF